VLKRNRLSNSIAFHSRVWHKASPILAMKKEKQKNPAAQLLALLKKVLPKATHDAALAGKIFQAVEEELQATSRVNAFEKFCERVEIKDLEPGSVEELKQQLDTAFAGAEVTLKPNRKEKRLAVELAMPDGSQLTGTIRVNPKAGEPEEEEQPPAKFTAFPVCLPGDKELVWLLARRENLAPEEGAIALTRLQEEFWGSKTGQKLLRDRVERSFPEFINRVPAGMLSEAGLKRHYKAPEPIKALRR